MTTRNGVCAMVGHMSEGTSASYSDAILRHYRTEAESHGPEASSTMRDDVTRNREIEAIRRLLDHAGTLRGSSAKDVIDIGCGNGYLLETLRKQQPAETLTGIEYTPEFVEIAKARKVENCSIIHGDVRALPFPDASFDVAITERCVINVMDTADQARALTEIARIIRPGGYFICIEAFMDGLRQLNEARDELGLPPNEVPHHNLWFEKQWFLDTIAPVFDVVELDSEAEPPLPEPNFLSSHYFISRVMYPSVTKRDVRYNTNFVKFFRFLPPMGNYSPVQVYFLQKRQ